MAMIIKQRARRPLVNATIFATGYRPDGVGGMADKPIMEIMIGVYKVFFSVSELRYVVDNMENALESAGK